MTHNYVTNGLQKSSNMPLTEIWCLVIFSLRHGHKESVLNLEAAGPKPVLVCVRLLLCESHWKKVLSGRIPQARHAMQQVQAMAWTSAVGGLVSKYPGF